MFSCDQRTFKNYYIVNLPTFQPFTLVLNASTFPWSHITLVDWQKVGTAATLFPIHPRSHMSSISAKPTRLQPIVFLYSAFVEIWNPLSSQDIWCAISVLSVQLLMVPDGSLLTLNYHSNHSSTTIQISPN